MGDKPLTWQQVLIVFCVIGLLPAAVFAWGGNIPSEARPWGVLAFCVLIGVITWLSVSHWRKIHRLDLQPDILAHLFPPNAAWQIGPMHFVMIGRQMGRWLHVTIVVQNLRDGDGEISLRLSPEISDTAWVPRNDQTFATPPTDFHSALFPASVIMATTRIPLTNMPKPTKIRLGLQASASAKGIDVRFGRRRAVTKPTSSWVTLLALLGGHIHFGGGTFLRIDYVPPIEIEPDPYAESAPPNEWDAQTLWTPDHPASVSEIAATINDAISNSATPSTITRPTTGKGQKL